ncbi:hypothetical protein ACH49_14405 [Streptomyces leeuwenhoekii]|uniref:Uncharacterized protein n=1 Tax=Streptomyces leeuwenhoekii TaxID=1437453 RepID=A0ABR5HY99_STRLW|nr:hypothetical protein [Streptomyces leeuwenhoekii]KMS78782.1 hypothetical protein ACH49_14405 [Streptomyces leeuwenhoekii]
MPLRLRLRLAGLCETALLALVRLLLPAEGRHRATVPPSPPAPPHSPSPAPEPVWFDTPLVRPYLLARDGHPAGVSA